MGQAMLKSSVYCWKPVPTRTWLTATTAPLLCMHHDLAALKSPAYGGQNRQVRKRVDCDVCRVAASQTTRLEHWGYWLLRYLLVVLLYSGVWTPLG